MNSIVVDLSYIIRVFHIQMQDYRKVWQVNDVQVAQKLDIGIFWGGLLSSTQRQQGWFSLYFVTSLTTPVTVTFKTYLCL